MKNKDQILLEQAYNAVSNQIIITFNSNYNGWDVNPDHYELEKELTEYGSKLYNKNGDLVHDADENIVKEIVHKHFKEATVKFQIDERSS